eukprot:1571306-Amphidinium_carterae.1
MDFKICEATMLAKLLGKTSTETRQQETQAFRLESLVQQSSTDLRLQADVVAVSAAITACARGGRWQISLDLLGEPCRQSTASDLRLRQSLPNYMCSMGRKQ